MKIKSKKFISGDLTRLNPYKATRCGPVEACQYELIEGLQYLIYLEDGRQITGTFYKKGLQNSMMPQAKISSEVKIGHEVHMTSHHSVFELKSQMHKDEKIHCDQIQHSFHVERSLPVTSIITEQVFNLAPNFEFNSFQKSVSSAELERNSLPMQIQDATFQQKQEIQQHTAMECSESLWPQNTTENNCQLFPQNHKIMEADNSVMDKTNLQNDGSLSECDVNIPSNCFSDREIEISQNKVSSVVFDESLQQSDIFLMQTEVISQQVDVSLKQIDSGKQIHDLPSSEINSQDLEYFPAKNTSSQNNLLIFKKTDESVSLASTMKYMQQHSNISQHFLIPHESLQHPSFGTIKEKDWVYSVENEIMLQQDEMMPQQDEMLPQQDEVLSQQDEMLPQQDEMLPQPDEMLQQPDEMLQQQDEMLPQPDEVLPQQDEMMPQLDEILPHQVIKSEVKQTFNNFQVKSETLENVTSQDISNKLSEETIKELIMPEFVLGELPDEPHLNSSYDVDQHNSDVLQQPHLTANILDQPVEQLVDSTTRNKKVIHISHQTSEEETNSVQVTERSTLFQPESNSSCPLTPQENCYSKMLYRLKVSPNNNSSDAHERISSLAFDVHTSIAANETDASDEKIMVCQSVVSPVVVHSMEASNNQHESKEMSCSSEESKVNIQLNHVLSKATTSRITPLLATSVTKNQEVSVCTVMPIAKPSCAKLLSLPPPTPTPQGKNPIFITPNQFKVLTSICRQNFPKATALVVPNTHIKPTEDVVHVLSSDDEEETNVQSVRPMQNQHSKQLTNSTNNPDFLLDCFLRQAFFGRGRGGSFRVCHMALEFIRLSNISNTNHLDVPLTEVLKISIHHGLCGPVFFLKVSEEFRKLVESQLCFDATIFDPCSEDPGKSHILLIPSKKNSVDKSNLSQSGVTTCIEIISKHLVDKFGHVIQISTLNGSETSDLIGCVLNVLNHSVNKANELPPLSSSSHSLSSSVTTVSTATITTSIQMTASAHQLSSPSFVIVGGNHPINILGSNNINITNNIFNINVPSNVVRTSIGTPRTQIIVLAKKLSSMSTTERTQEPKNRGPIVSLFTYPPTPGPGRMTITTEDYYCLNDGELLNDNIIDFYLKYFLEEHLDEETHNRVHLFSSFFYGKIVAEERLPESAAVSSSQTPQQTRHSRVKTWTRHVDLFSKDFVIIPIIENSHWFLAVICFPALKSPIIEHYQPTTDIADVSQNQGPMIRLKQPCILIFDSLGMVGHQTVTKMLREYLQEEWNLKKQRLEGTREFSENTFPGFNPTCPQQNNSTDCGVFVLKYVECFFKNPIKDFIMPITNTAEWFSHEIISEKRKEIQDLIMRLHNVTTK